MFVTLLDSVYGVCSSTMPCYFFVYINKDKLGWSPAKGNAYKFSIFREAKSFIERSKHTKGFELNQEHRDKCIIQSCKKCSRRNKIYRP